MPPDLEKILIIQTAFIGDVILATAIAESLHARYSDAQIDFLLRKGNEDLLEGHPFITRVWVWEKKRKWKSMREIIRHVRKERYDLVINAQRFFSSGLFTSLSGAQKTVGFRKNPMSYSFSKRVKHSIGDGQHEVDRNFQLIKHLQGIVKARPRLYPPEVDLVSLGITKQYITISPASVWFTKQWPEEKWIQLIDKVPSGYQVVLLGGPGDKELCKKITESCKNSNIIDLSGSLSLLGSAAVIKKAAMNYVNDSAPLHLASATNAPVCAVFCSTIPEFGFGPLSDQSYTMETELNLSCRPCGLHGKKQCPEGHFKCTHIDTKRMISLLE